MARAFDRLLEGPLPGPKIGQERICWSGRVKGCTGPRQAERVTGRFSCLAQNTTGDTDNFYKTICPDRHLVVYAGQDINNKETNTNGKDKNRQQRTGLDAGTGSLDDKKAGSLGDWCLRAND